LRFLNQEDAMRSMFATLSCAAALLSILTTSGRPVTATSSLFEALRRNDTASVKTLIGSGADVSSGDDTGATPLMYAALYTGPDSLHTLLEHRAAVNVANKYGATPLMWAASRTANVKVLVDGGADVNARASDGVTALVAAARYSNADAMRILLAAGADTKAPHTRTLLLTAAYFAPTSDIRDLLAEANVVVSSPADVKGPVLNRNRGDIASLSRLLAAKVDPKEEVPLITLSLPSFFMAAREGQVDAMKAFVAAGMDPNYTGPRGWTALMLAAGGDTASVPAMQYLIASGADLGAVDADGRTALDWALTRGTTEASTFLSAAGARTNAAAAPAPNPIATPRTAADAVARAIARLQPAGPAFNDRTKCNSCHNQNIPGVAITLAQRHGVHIDEGLAGHSLLVTNRQWRGRREVVLLGDTTGGGFQANAEYTLFEMAEERAASTANSDALVLGLAARQGADGSWPVGADIRPPLTGSAVTGTALAMRGLREYAPAGRRDEMSAHAGRAAGYLRHARPRDTQEQVFKLLGLIWAGGSEEEIRVEKAALIALQRPDGGWAQMTSMAPDAYATGQALYALHAAKVPARDRVYRKGTDYLLRTQLEDGTWFVQTRAFGFQPYFETGFPHGRSQFISTVATSWAAVALTYTLDTE
jgi:ankyrin repeat protein